MILSLSLFFFNPTLLKYNIYKKPAYLMYTVWRFYIEFFTNPLKKISEEIDYRFEVLRS